ncbi:MAG: hypothetical protein HY961_15800, partial [Ignavibacteriae bacterium]|nr:hypothetical protein [Ignavibacteriota bacterium]
QGVLPINLSRLAVTGCSYAGKMALYAGAFDERIALTISQESGGGGATSWRYSQTEPAGTVETLGATSHQWFREEMFQFAGANVSKLPEDHHELMAMCAPRALYATANPDYTWLSNPSCHVCSRAVQQVYNTLGIAERFGFSVVGGHSHCSVPGNQIPEVEAFVEKFLLGNNSVNTNIATTPYTIDLTPWITWTNPTLANDTTLFTSLVYPVDRQSALDTAITFRWNKIEGVQRYFIQLSTDPASHNIVKSDSTTDTLATFIGLLDSTRYHWRVQVRNATGLGPWSNVWSFFTTASLPTKPQLVSAALNQTGFVTFLWRKEPVADQYLLQTSIALSFSPIFRSASTSDTGKTLSFFREGLPYYWRVQAENAAGPGPWSDVGSFTLFYAPTDLVLQRSVSNEITLTWSDNSTVEEGYVIERKQSPQPSFVVLDTLHGSGNTYVDSTVEVHQAYTYRVKAFRGSMESGYSNEASLTVGVNEGEGLPKEYSLGQNYPNPFNPSTTIRYALTPLRGGTPVTSPSGRGEKGVRVSLKIYDLLGREVATLVNEVKQPGEYTVQWDAQGVSGGVYFYRLRSGDASASSEHSPSAGSGQSFVQTKRLVVVK